MSVVDATGFCHEALFYAGDDEYLEGTVPFLREAVDAGGAALVAVSERKIRLLSDALGYDAAAVRFEDMSRLGANPNRIIPAWREFLASHIESGRPIRGIGEPIWPGRGSAELVECRRHESLLNLAFAGSGNWSLLCPYDTDGLDDAVLQEARTTHPHVVENGLRHVSDTYLDPCRGEAPFDDELPLPARKALEMSFTVDDLSTVRRCVSLRAHMAGLGPKRASDLVLAVNELATNSVRHADGRGTLRIWQEDGALLSEVIDRGRIDDLLVGRARPDKRRPGGRGLWMVNHLCDLVQIRTTDDGNVVRLHMWLDAR